MNRMQLGMIGLGRMGANMVRRLIRGGHHCVVYDRNREAVNGLVKEGAVGAASLDEFAATLAKPRTAWLMVPAAVVDSTLKDLAARMQADDAIIDGGNSYYIDDIRRARDLQAKGIHYLDVGTSGGIWGLERGYCLMIGGDLTAVKRLDPIFKTLAPGRGSIPRTPGREKVRGTAEHGRDRRRRPGAGPERRAVSAVYVTRRGRFRHEGPVRHALRVRRPRRTGNGGIDRNSEEEGVKRKE